jgi:hypothetical protein
MQNIISRIIYGRYYTTEYDIMSPSYNVINVKSYDNISKKNILNIKLEASLIGIKEINFINIDNNKNRIVRFCESDIVLLYDYVNLAIMHIIDNFNHFIHQYIIFQLFNDLSSVPEAKKFHRLWDNPLFNKKFNILEKKIKLNNIEKKIENMKAKHLKENHMLKKYQDEFKLLIGPNNFCMDINIY